MDTRRAETARQATDKRMVEGDIKILVPGSTNDQQCYRTDNNVFGSTKRLAVAKMTQVDLLNQHISVRH